VSRVLVVQTGMREVLRGWERIHCDSNLYACRQDGEESSPEGESQPRRHLEIVRFSRTPKSLEVPLRSELLHLQAQEQQPLGPSFIKQAAN
jgi:hypothetical protein